MKKALVTGGAGFVGSHLIDALLIDGWNIIIIDDLSTGLKENVPDSPDVRFIERSITEPGLAEYMKDIDCVFHLAAQVSVQKSVEDPIGSHDVNVNGFLNVLEAMRETGTRRLVHISSASIYGNKAPIPVVEDTPYAPESPYGLHKVICEQYVKLYEALYDIETVIFRPFNLYGPRQRSDSPYSGVIAKFANAAREGVQPTIFGDGSYVRDFLYVTDAVQAFVRGANSSEAVGKTFNIGTGSGITILNLAKKIYSLCDKECLPEFKEARTGDIAKSITDSSYIQNVLGWTANVSLDDGLRKTIAI